MVKVLVAGAEGGLGRAFVAALGAGFDTVALGRKGLDVSRRNDVAARLKEIRPEVVIDCAGWSDVDGCENDRWRAYLSNRDGAEHLARGAAEAGALVVYPGCDLVFDGLRAHPYTEEDPPNPLSVYGDTKLAGELAVMSHGPRYLILRSGWLFGEHGRSYVNDLLGWRLTDEVVFGYEDHKAQPTSQADFARAAVELIRRGQTGLWNVASEGEGTQYDVALETYRILGEEKVKVKPLRRGSGNRTALRPRYSVLDGSKLKAAGIGMRPWRDALREFLEARGKK